MDKELDQGRRNTLFAGGTLIFGSFLTQANAQRSLEKTNTEFK